MRNSFAVRNPRLVPLPLSVNFALPHRTFFRQWLLLRQKRYPPYRTCRLSGLSRRPLSVNIPLPLYYALRRQQRSDRSAIQNAAVERTGLRHVRTAHINRSSTSGGSGLRIGAYCGKALFTFSPVNESSNDKKTRTSAGSRWRRTAAEDGEATPLTDGGQRVLLSVRVLSRRCLL